MDFKEYAIKKIKESEEVSKLLGVSETEAVHMALNLLIGVVFKSAGAEKRDVTELFGATIGGQDDEFHFHFSIGNRAKIFNEITSDKNFNDAVESLEEYLEKKENDK